MMSKTEIWAQAPSLLQMGSQFVSLGLIPKARDSEIISATDYSYHFPLKQEMRFQRIKDLLPSCSLE